MWGKMIEGAVKVGLRSIVCAAWIICLSANVFGLTIEDVLAPDFFSDETRFFLTEDTVIKEKPYGKLGKESNKNYKDIILIITTGVDSSKTRHYEEILYGIRKCTNKFLGKKRYYLFKENWNVQSIKKLRTPDDKQRETSKLVQKSARRLFGENVVITNESMVASSSTTRKTKHKGVKPMAPYSIEGSYKEYIESYGGEYYGMTHVASTNISENTAVITGTITETGLLGPWDDCELEVPAECRIDYCRKLKLKGTTVSVEQEFTVDYSDLYLFHNQIKTNYTLKLRPDGSCLNESEKFKRNSYDEISGVYLDYLLGE